MSDKTISRREFIKLVSLASLLSFPKSDAGRVQSGADKPNVLFVLFDTLSAAHISLYGYPRQTMPNLARFADRATVFHKHYSPGSFTIPGTASLLTGTYPWTHRALHLNSTVADRLAGHNLFNAFGNEYFKFGFSHNIMANYLLHQFIDDLDEFVFPKETALLDTYFADEVFLDDYRIASISERTSFQPIGELPNSLFLYWILKFFQDRKRFDVKRPYRDQHPQRTIGHFGLVYFLEDTIDWMIDKIAGFTQPYVSYFHLWPPHDPYTPSKAFIDHFADGWEPLSKPDHVFTDKVSQEKMNIERQKYDEYIGFVDAEFGRLMDALEQQGTLENTWVIFTSDHGEMFERGILRHSTETLFDPVVRVPLLISAPGQHTRQDVFTPTSSIDILPTLMHVTGKAVPDWCEGEVLPPYADGGGAGERGIFMMDAKGNSKFQALRKATVALVKGRYKLIYYLGYRDYDGVFELYDLEADPEELVDLYEVSEVIAKPMREELLARLAQANEGFPGGG